MSICSCEEKRVREREREIEKEIERERERERERRLLKGEAIFGFYLFKQREGRRGGKASFKKRLRVGTHPKFFELFIWDSSNPNLYKCDFNCFSSVCCCFEVF